MTMRRQILRLALTSLLAAGAADAAPLATQLFGSIDTPSNQQPMPIGGYDRGCAAGLVELPESGPTWQAMRLSRNRNWGMPVTIEYVEELSVKVQSAGWRGLYIGDIGQPRGGPSVSGHQSHQIGLDVDIWMLAPSRLNLTRAQRESISSVSVRSEDQRSLNGNWTPALGEVLKIAASDPRVDRIFVTAPVKIELCRTAKRKDKEWLQKIRPYWGHDSHFHVRLKCPPGATLCKTQKPTVRELSDGGSGCDETLTWWVTDALNPPKATKKEKPAPPKRGPRQYTMADLPKQCAGVLVSP